MKETKNKRHTVHVPVDETKFKKLLKEARKEQDLTGNGNIGVATILQRLIDEFLLKRYPQDNGG